MATVSLDGVSKVFASDVTAVDRVDLEVKDREFLVLVGPSGCGKTTLLRLIAGLETASKGEIRIGKTVVNQVAPKDRNIAMVFQNYALYPHMTVYNNMAFGLQLRYGGWLKRIWKRLTDSTGATAMAERRRGISGRVRQAAGMLGIEHLLDRMPGQLSGGERQRVALGRAIVREPAAFLFDEPLSNLDAKLRVEMRRELKRLHKELDATMIYVTHDQVEAMTLGDRVVVMNGGRVQQVGRPMDVYDAPKNRFVASFIGTPAMNFVSGRLEETQDGPRFCGSGITMPLAGSSLASEQKIEKHIGKDVIFGIRPEDISIESTSGQNPGRVLDVELLGDAALLHVEAGGVPPESSADSARLTVKTNSRTAFRTGDRIELNYDRDRGHFYDPQSGDSLAHSESE